MRLRILSWAPGADEMPGLGLSARDARGMCHAPLPGPGGTLEPLSGLGHGTILVHINNTNPVLLEYSEQRTAADTFGVEVAHDGLEVEL